MLNEVNQYVSLNIEQSFVGTFMILAEWRNVHPYPHGSCDFYDILENYPTTRSFINQVLSYNCNNFCLRLRKHLIYFVLRIIGIKI